MTITIDPSQRFDCVLKSQVGKKDPATLVVRPLTVRERQILYTEHDGQGFGLLWSVIETCVVDWKNVHGHDGPLAFDRDSIEHFREDDVLGAFEFITKLSTVTAEEAGK